MDQPIPLRPRQPGHRTAHRSPAGRVAGGVVEPARSRSTVSTPDVGQLPGLPEHLVSRPRLDAALDDAIRQPLTLLRAPAGTGKTVTVASWASGGTAPGPVVWVTVGAADLAGSGLWALIVEELHHHGLTAGSPLPGPGALAYDRVFLFSLARQLARWPEPLVLVVDAECPLPVATGAGLHYLVQHAAGRIRLVLLSRQEPPLPVWRYRLAGTVSELRMTELEFAEVEARALLRSHGVALRAEALTALVRRTRGWAVGLTLAAQALAGHPDPDAGVRELHGDRGAVAEYLLTEILEAQPVGVRTLLLQTSGADLLRPGLVEALAGRRAPRLLDELLRRNVLLEPVPGLPGSYRYHPLLQELLRSRLGVECPERAVDLQRATSAWKAGNGFLREAVEGAVARSAWSEACGYVVDRLAVGELLGRPPGRLADAFARMPGTVPGAPAAVVRAALLLAADQGSASRADLERAETLAGQQPAPGMRLALDVVRLALASRCGTPLETLRLADAADASLAGQAEPDVAEHPELAGLITAARATAHLALGDLEAAARALDTGPGSAALGTPLPGSDVHALAALVAAWQGRLRRAEVLARGLSPVDSVHRSEPASAEVVLAWVAAERYDAEGVPLLERGRLAVLPDGDLARGMLALARARAHRADGDLERSLAELTDPRLISLPGWLSDRLRAEVAAVHLEAGRSQQAAATLLKITSATPEAMLVEARLALADGTASTGMPDSQPSADTSLEVQVSADLVQTAVLLRHGDHREALVALTRALRLAAPELLRRPFEEAPPEAHRLLRGHPELAARHHWLGVQPTGTSGGPTSTRTTADPVLVEPLTGREREVLTLLADLLTTEEIAGTLFVSVNTVRTHVRSILRKLGVNRRNEAIRRARALDILPDQPTHLGITHYG